MSVKSVATLGISAGIAKYNKVSFASANNFTTTGSPTISASGGGAGGPSGAGGSGVVIIKVSKF